MDEAGAECVEGNVNISCTNETCSCAFFNSMKLSCAHTIAYSNNFRRHTSLQATFLRRSIDKRKCAVHKGIRIFGYSAYSGGGCSKSSTTNPTQLDTKPEVQSCRKKAKKICEIIVKKSQNSKYIWQS